MIIVDNALSFREEVDNPIKVGVVGAGFMSVGLINQIERHTPGMKVVAICNRTLDRAVKCYEKAGVSNVEVCDTPQQINENIIAKKYSICESPETLCQAEEVDIIVEATGAIEYGASVILTAIKAGKPILMLNPELDATVGPILKHYADKAEVMLSQTDGDQPGVIMNLFRYVKGLGLTPLVCGNIKGFLDEHKTPTDMEEFARNVNQGTRMITNFTDGTKLSFEQASVANATGMGVAKRGMSAYRSKEHIDKLTSIHDVEELKSLGGIVDFVVGAKPGPGVYVYGATNDPMVKDYLKYLKMGPGPLYSFYTPYHLCFFDIPSSIARAFHFGDPVMYPKAGPVVEVVAIAKRDLKAGETLDGYGGYLSYGVCENYDVAREENLLPIGLAEDVVLKRNVPKDKAVTFDDIVYPEDRLVYRLYEDQLKMFLPTPARVNA
ncbi:Gfo/Idh/MocA family oxidoreductase [Porifericola rhodea]|uniref:NAD(P)H-dependent oxidoreductase n=1 Tax=Porifericola rhodea TaxID=930972 RepID=UPI0026670E8E|nr:Gfo/Idh/MocA family oxidoreductase [Porifericola rhodea]WKN32611.1 Gfo/Idh/MocA family oxidoreductase [Porifericola rhodea]